MPAMRWEKREEKSSWRANAGWSSGGRPLGLPVPDGRSGGVSEAISNLRDCFVVPTGLLAMTASSGLPFRTQAQEFPTDSSNISLSRFIRRRVKKEWGSAFTLRNSWWNETAAGLRLKAGKAKEPSSCWSLKSSEPNERQIKQEAASGTAGYCPK